ncbi:LysR family transcriptional regulator [Staphylococcus hsinchuensis]|uniref:LysR family transcriptional regulator n=1 Tax=Staphylococcus hsinchuensis TaxID=3051183 RepID=A0ABZ3EFZ8_9STAP
MNFEQLTYVKKIYELESIIQAADKMHVSQSAMNQSLRALEFELGYQLFERSRRGTFATEIGQRIIPYIIDILDARTQLLQEVDSLKSNLTGSLKIATIPTLFNKIIPKALSAFKKDFPHIEVQVFESDKDKVIKMMENNEVDIGLIGKRESETFAKTLTSYPLNISTDFRLIVPKKSKLSLRENVDLSMIQPYPFVLYDRNFYHENLKNFEDKNGPLKIVFKTNNPSVLIKTISEGLGVSIVSRLMLEDDPYIASGMVEMVTIGAPFDYFLHFVAMTHKDSNNLTTIETFVDYLKH